MFRHVIFLVTFFCILFSLSCPAFAAKITWDNGEPNDWRWSEPNNWDTDTVPGAGDRAHLQKADFDDRCIFDANMNAEVDELLVGKAWGPQYFIMTGGSLSIGDYGSGWHIGAWTDGNGVFEISDGNVVVNEKWFIGRQDNAKGTVNMSGGNIEVSKSLILGGQDNAEGTLTMSGGNIQTVQDILVAGWWNTGSDPNISGEINLNGGTLRGRNLIFDYEDKWVTENLGHLDITGGTLILQGSDRDDIEEFESEGLVTAYNGNPRASLNIVEDGEFTTVTAFLAPDELAFGPSPANGEEVTSLTPPITLSWGEGLFIGDTNSHDVYFGSTFGEVNEADIYTPDIYKGRQDANSYGPLTDIILGETYYWRVDEVNEANTPDDIWEGDVWSFDVPYVIVEDYEDYNGISVDSVWIASGDASVSDVNSFNEDEQLFIHGGDFAMDLSYDGGPSHATRTFAAAQDWTLGSAKTLILFFHASENNTGGPLSVTLTDDDSDTSPTINYPESNDLDAVKSGYGWEVFAIDLEDFNSVNMDLDKVKSMKISVGSGSGTLYIDDIRLYGQVCVEDYRPAGDFTADCFVDNNDLEELSSYWLDSEMTVTASPPDNGQLQVHYKFDREGSDWIATDSSGNGRDGTLKVIPSGWVETGCYDGKCLDLHPGSTSNWIDCPSSVFDSNSEVTISFWIKGDDIIPGGGQILKGKAEGKWAFGGYIPNATGRNVQFSIGYDTTDPLDYYDSVYWYDVLPTDWKGDWNHYAFVKNTNTGFMGIYLDGVLVAQLTDAFKPIIISTWLIGNDTGNSAEATIDEFRVYDYALSQGEIISLAGKSTVDQPILAPVDPVADGTINLKDLAALAADWQEEVLWP